MRLGLVVATGLACALAGLAAGVTLGFWSARRLAVPQELIAVGFSSERAQVAFANAEPQAAWEVITRHKDLVERDGKCLGAPGQHLELMVSHARLAVLSRELGRPDAIPLASAVESAE